MNILIVYKYRYFFFRGMRVVVINRNSFLMRNDFVGKNVFFKLEIIFNSFLWFLVEFFKVRIKMWVVRRWDVEM